MNKKIILCLLTILMLCVWWQSTTWWQIGLGGLMSSVMAGITLLSFIAPEK